MNPLSIYTLKVLRKFYAETFRVKALPRPSCEQGLDVVFTCFIYDKLIDDKPCMIARFGAFELNTAVNYLGLKNKIEIS